MLGFQGFQKLTRVGKGLYSGDQIYYGLSRLTQIKAYQVLSKLTKVYQGLTCMPM